MSDQISEPTTEQPKPKKEPRKNRKKMARENPEAGPTAPAVPSFTEPPAINCLHDKVLPLSAFMEHPKNPNKHPPGQIALLAKVILSNGWRNPLVVSNLSGLLIRGHGRLMAARVAGLENAPVSYQDYASTEDELSDLLADNRIAELAAMDTETILALVRELQESGHPEFATGFTEVDIQNMTLAAPDMDETPTGQFAEEGASKRTSGTFPLLVLNGRKYPLGNDELEALIKLGDEYIAKNENLVGFVSHLLALSK